MKSLIRHCDMEAIGSALIQEAEQKLQDKLQGQARQEVQTVLEAVRSAEEQISHATETKKFYLRRLKAIQDGKFSLDQYTGKVTYKEKELNERR